MKNAGTSPYWLILKCSTVGRRLWPKKSHYSITTKTLSDSFILHC